MNTTDTGLVFLTAPLLIFGVVLLFMAILMPYYVYKIRHISQDLLKTNRTTNDLLRQLIRAYGHDPEA